MHGSAPPENELQSHSPAVDSGEVAAAHLPAKGSWKRVAAWLILHRIEHCVTALAWDPFKQVPPSSDRTGAARLC